MKYKNLILKAVLLVCCIGMVACSEENDTYVQTAANNQPIKINISDAGIYHNDPTKAVTDATYVTRFEEGDQVGLLAVKSGTILPELQNLVLTYNGSSWEFPGNEKMELDREQSEGAIFYAYYPYQEDLLSKFNPSLDDPFETLVNNWVPGNDQQGENYSNYDLMTGATTAIVRDGDYMLDFALNHRMALAVIELPAVYYTFTNKDPEIPPYITLNNAAFTVTRQGEATETVLPYYDEETLTYRILLEPTTVYTLRGEFVKKGQTNGFETVINGLNNGKYALYIVDGGLSRMTHELKVGDLYYADGSIVSVDEENPDPTDCIGVVYHLGNVQPSVLYPDYYTSGQDVLQREHPDCIHAIVIGIKESANRFTDVQREMRAWYLGEESLLTTYIDLSGNVWDNGATSSTAAAARDQVLGYNNTQLIKMYAELNPGNWYFLDALNGYEDAAPLVTTGWYLPSAGEYGIYTDLSGGIMTSRAAYNIINAQMTKVSGVTIDDGAKCWTSTERNNANMYYRNIDFSSNTGAITSAQNGTGGRKYLEGHEYKYRFFLMF